MINVKYYDEKDFENIIKTFIICPNCLEINNLRSIYNEQSEYEIEINEHGNIEEKKIENYESDLIEIYCPNCNKSYNSYRIDSFVVYIVKENNDLIIYINNEIKICFDSNKIEKLKEIVLNMTL